jgi:hypothetical protein
MSAGPEQKSREGGMERGLDSFALAFRLATIGVAAAIIVSGLMSAGFWIFTFWGFNFFKVVLSCLAVGAVIGLLTEQWVWCVAGQPAHRHCALRNA